MKIVKPNNIFKKRQSVSVESTDMAAIETSSGLSSKKSKGGGKPPLLSGIDAYLTLGSESPPGMVLVAKRKASSPLHIDHYLKTGRQLSVYLNKDLVDQHPAARFAVDGYLRLGFWRSHRMRVPLVLLGGEVNEGGANLEILVFQGGRLIDVNEKLLPASHSPEFATALDVAIEGVRNRYKGCVIEQAGPIQRIGNPHIKRYHGGGVFRRLRTVALRKTSGKALEYVGPGALVAASLLFFGYTLSSGINAHQASIAEAHILDDRLQQFASDTHSIDILEARQVFTNQLSDTSVETGYVEQIVRIAAASQHIPGSVISSLQAPVGGSERVAALLTLQVPKMSYESPLLHGRDVLDQLARHLGQSVRLAQRGGIQDGDEFVHFRIEVLNG